MELTIKKIRKLTWSDISNGADLKERMELANYFDQVPTLQAFVRLRSGYKLAQKKCKNNGVGTPISTYLNSFKKGSKKLRAILSKAKFQKGTAISRQIRTFCYLVGTEIPEPDIIKKIHIAWTKNFFSNDVRSFVFKFFNNTLGLAARVQHFNANTDPACSMCKKSKNLPAPRETFDHFFWYCPHVESIRKIFETRIMAMQITKWYFFIGPEGNSQHTDAIRCILDIFRYTLWTFKLRNRKLNWHSFYDSYNYTMGILVNTSKKLETQLTNFYRYRDE
jgi:hypothetical protein